MLVKNLYIKMTQVNFNYHGGNILVLCNKTDTMRYIFQKFAMKANISLDSVYFIYSGNIVNQDLTVDQVSNNDDRNRNIMNILVTDYNKYNIMRSNTISSSSMNFIYPDKSNPIYQTIPTFGAEIPYQAIPTHQTNQILRTNSAFQSSPKILQEESPYQFQEIPTFQSNPIYQDIQIFQTNQAGPKYQVNPIYQDFSIFQTNQSGSKNPTNQIFQLEPTNQANPILQTNPTIIIDSPYQGNPTFQNQQILTKEPTKNIIPQTINYSNINQITPINSPQNIQQNNNQIVNQLNNNAIRIQSPQQQPYGPIYHTINELNNKIKIIEDKIKEKSKNVERQVKDMKNRLKIVKKIKKRFPDGMYYGEFQNNNISGLGIFEGDNGERYEGEWLNGFRNGIGVVYKKDGKIFMGKYKQNKKSGFCIEEFAESKYEGTYINNYLSGIAIVTYKDGDKYIGQIDNSKYNGIGKFIPKTNKYFIGEYKDGHRCLGITFNPEDKGLFEAKWEYNKEKNQYIARGIYYLPDGTKEKKEKRIDLDDDDKKEKQMTGYLFNIIKNLGKILDLSDL